jgi:hypothetical protein
VGGEVWRVPYLEGPQRGGGASSEGQRTLTFAWLISQMYPECRHFGYERTWFRVLIENSYAVCRGCVLMTCSLYSGTIFLVVNGHHHTLESEGKREGMMEADGAAVLSQRTS